MAPAAAELTNGVALMLATLVLLVLLTVALGLATWALGIPN